MKIIINLTVFFLEMFTGYSCNRHSEINYANSPYIKVEMYCACIKTIPSNDGYAVIATCTSPQQIPPAMFVKPELLYYSTTDTLVINRLRNLFFESKYQSDTLIGGTDSRFVVLMKNNESVVDTLAFLDQTVFTLNEKHQFTYRTNIIDSVIKIIGKVKLECD